MQKNLNIIPTSLLEAYIQGFGADLHEEFEMLHDSDLSIETFSFYTSVSAVFSSKIEGEDIELDSFLKHKRLGAHYKPDYTQKIDDLYNAYEFAKKNTLTSASLLQAHVLLTKNILQPSQQGKFRKGNMFVLTDDGKIEYVAATPEMVEPEMQKLHDDLEILLETDLSFAEVFFYAALLHLVFVKIHPFEDGNGRTGRLLEKWFLAEKLGPKAWFLQSEKHYYNNHSAYYHNIRILGLEYDTLDYSQAMDFIKMLPESILI